MDQTEEFRELGRQDQVVAAARRVAAAWREGRLTEECVAELEKALNLLVQ